MSAPNRYKGNALKVFFPTLATEISGDYTSFTPDATQDKTEVTAGNDSVKVYIPTQTDATFDLTVYDVGTSHSMGTAVYLGKEGTLFFAPQGTATGKPAYAIKCFVSKDTMPIEFNAGVRRQLQFTPMDTWYADYRTMQSTWNSGTIVP